jgi:L-amino acid N-acyltransferase YncA
MMIARPANRADAPAIVRIYNEGIRERVATFETTERAVADVERWFDGRHPVVVVENEARVVGFAATSAYRTRECYAGVAECSVYVAGESRGRGAGALALQAVIDAATSAGFWKLVSRIFLENAASRALVQRCGFREVGVYRRHARLDGVWRDVVIVERLLG